MKRAGDSLMGFSLPTVLVISVLMALILLSALTFVNLDRINYALYHRQKQWTLDLHSAAARYLVDSTLAGPGDSVSVALFDEEETGVTISVSRWGLYEVAAFRSEHLPFPFIQVVGKASPSDYESALYVTDRNRPLSLAGSTHVQGVVYAPQSGINYTELMGNPFSGPSVPVEKWRVSTMQLPTVDSTVFAYLDSLSSLRPKAWYHLNVPKARTSFLSPTNLSYIRNDDEILEMRGNRILYADRIKIRRESRLDEILILARTATIEDGFEGSLQLFCSDSIVVGEGARLQYPSGLYVSNEERHPCITIRDGSRVCGYVIAMTGGREDMMLEDPCLRMEGSARIEGLLYVDGSACVAGEVRGSTYLRDCFFEISGEKYPGVLNDCIFERPDKATYPIFLEGPYRRRVVKKVH